MTLYDYLNIECIKRGISLRELADEIGVTYPTINNIKSKRPNLYTYNKLMKYFDVDAAFLYQLPIKKEEK